jgi:hypothetical protein
VNRDVVVEYRGINFAQNIRGVFLKSLRYARPSVGRDDTVVPYVYVLAAVIGVATVVAALVGAVPVWLPVVGVVLYLLARLAIASRKSRQISYFWRSPVRLMLLLLIGLVMDIGKTYGFAMGIITRFLRRRSLVG